MSLHTPVDVPMLIVSANSSSERRVTPSWTIAHFKARLEPITGIPAVSQKLSLRVSSQDATVIEAADEESTTLATFPLQPYAEITVQDTRPPSARTDFTDVSAVPKYVMPAEEYESRSDSVLAWKKAQKLGRFDPDAPSLEQQKIRALEREIEERGITVDARCRLPPSTTRLGRVAFIGPVPQLPGTHGTPWIGVELDEPTGKNDGSIDGKRYFECKPSFGVFVRPDRVEVGDFPPLDDLGEEMEEL